MTDTITIRTMPPYGPHSAACWSSAAPHVERTAISPAGDLLANAQGSRPQARAVSLVHVPTYTGRYPDVASHRLAYTQKRFGR